MLVDDEMGERRVERGVDKILYYIRIGSAR